MYWQRFMLPWRSIGLLFTSALVTPVVAQMARPQVAIFPFVDGTGGTNRGAGAAASQTLIDELAAQSRLLGVVVGDSLGAGAIDEARALDAGKTRGARFVFVGTVISATSREGSRGGWLPKIKGQTVHLTVRSIEAKTELQGVLYDVATGERLFATKTRGSHKDNSYSGRVWSSWGSWDVGDHAAFMASPMGQAFLKASREMVKQIDKAAASRTPNG
ncbi:MAG: hypothetical protein AB1762_06925 [Gemmatimonadota bacterium]